MPLSISQIVRCLILLVPAVLCWRAGQAQQVPGVEYRHLTRSGPPQSIHVITFDLTRQDLALQATLGQRVHGLETVQEMALNLPRHLGTPLAAINGDFFEYKTEPRYQGTVAGIGLLDGELVAGPAGVTFWVDRARVPHIAPVQEQLSVTWPNGKSTAFALNCSPSDYKSEVRVNDLVLFTRHFGPSTRTDFVRELVLTPGLPLRPRTTREVRVKSVSTTGNTPIAPGTLVLSVARKANARIPTARPGDLLTVKTALSPDLTGARTAISGFPLLLRNGTPMPGLDAKARNPRTAIGYVGTRVFLVVVDGRQPMRSVGMTYAELAAFMRSLGCTDALNLDGGGSSTCWFNGAVRNTPSDGKPRLVGNALVLLRVPKP